MTNRDKIIFSRNKEIKKKLKSGVKAKELAIFYNLTLGRISQICK